MAKLTLSDLGNLQNETTAVATLNANNVAMEEAFENTLSRDGTDPNMMNADFDMNSNRILNLPMATDPTEPVRLQEVGDAPGYAAAAAASAAASEISNLSSGAFSVTSGIQASNSAASAVASAASAVQAQGYVLGLSGTSTSSVLIGTGAKFFTANTGKLWSAGQFVTLTSAANSANYMHGTVTSYNSVSGALVTNILDVGGSGTLADWNITISGTQGSAGATGATGAQGPAGTGNISGVTQYGVGIGVAAADMTSTAALTNGQLVVGQTGSNPLPKTITGDVTINAAGATAIKTSVSLTTPILGVAAATSVNKVALTAPATGSTLTIADGKTATVSNTLTFAGTDASTLNVGVGGTITGSSSGAVYYDNIPQNSQSAAYTLVLADAHKHIYHPSADTTARIWTIPANSSVAFPVGAAVTFINDSSAGVITLAITTDTLVLAGSGSTGSRTLAANGIATAIKVASTRWQISGTGIT